MTVHQLWIGGDMPAAESAWVAGVKKAAESAGWRHRLWDWPQLLKTYGAEPASALFQRLMADFPMPTTYTLMADYYRLRVLADGGGVYLDADFCATSWPDWPDGADIYVLGEFFTRTSPCNGFYYCRRPVIMHHAARLAAKRLLDALPPDAVDLPSRYVAMVRRDNRGGGLPNKGIGPGFMRRCVLPFWRHHGVSIDFIPASMVGHRQWKTPAALTHHGTAHWHEGGKKDNDPFWQDMAARADAITAANNAALRPLHLRPCGGIIAPPRSGFTKPAQPARGQAADIPPQFRLPRDVRRVIVLSNVTTGFAPDMLPLQSGDLVIHCNHARHREAAMRVKGTRHWLFVRHGKGRDPRGWHWYHEGTFDGFEKVFFVDDASMMQPFRWWRDFRAICKKSPTTGFIAANIMRETAPHLPLLLAGFDPGVKHGTPQWDGHAWATEAKWYRQRNFTLYRPRKQVKIMLLIASCCSYAGRTIRAKDARAVYEQRRACRLAWLNKLMPANVQAVMVVGRGLPVVEPMVRQLEVDDDFWHLPAKMKAAFKEVLRSSDFDWLVKCDDDSFMHLERLVQYVAQLPVGSRDIYGAPTRRRDCVCGGGGYVIHRDTVAAIAADSALPDRGREDVEVCKAVMRAGGKVIAEPRFNATASPSPAPGNDLISCHHLTPADMLRIHTDCWKI